MNNLSVIALLLPAAYLIGSIPFGWIVALLRGVDIRAHGSGNVGATNVGRVLGKRFGVLVFLLDVGKGFACTAIAGAWLSHALWESPPARRDLEWMAVGMACVLGNVFSIFLRFQGGKGVATGLGVLLGIYPYLTLPAAAALVVWTAVVKTTRYVSLGSITAVATLPATFLLFSHLLDWRLADHYPLLILLIVVGLLILLRHRSNVRRLLNGTENRIGTSRP